MTSWSLWRRWSRGNKRAIAKAAGLGIDLKKASFVHVPHHGSKHNMGPTMLNALVGQKLSAQQIQISIVSAPQKGDLKHPSRKVVNAFKRRGIQVLRLKIKYGIIVLMLLLEDGVMLLNCLYDSVAE